MKYRKEFPGEDELAVVVESNDHERNRQFVERLAAKLELETNLFTDVFYKGDLKSLGPKALLFVPDEDLVDLRQTLALYRPFIQKFTAATNLDSLFNLINQQFRTSKREENAENNSLVKAIPALERIVVQANAALSTPGTPVSPGVTALFGRARRRWTGPLTSLSPTAGIYLVTARAQGANDLSAKAVQRMRQLMEETIFEVPGLNVGLTGEPVLDYDEMEQSKHDATLAAIVSLVVSSLIFITAYREAGRPLKTVLCLVIGLGYSMAFTTLAVGHLNILTITFAPILIGLAIDFGIHFITRYEEETGHGRSEELAVDKAMVFTGQGIITGALTTAGAFLAMWLTDFKGIQEMGDYFRRRPGLVPGADDDAASGVVDGRPPRPDAPGCAHRRGGGQARPHRRISGCAVPWWVIAATGVLCAGGGHSVWQGLFRLQFAQHAEQRAGLRGL